MNQPAQLATEDLVRRSVDGELDAFEQLVRHHQPEIYRYLRRHCRSDEDARDLCQLVFLRAYRNLGGFEGRCLFRTWLYRIATNLARNYHRDRARRPEESLTTRGRADGDGERGAAEREIADDRTPSHDARLVAGEARERLRAAVEQLPPRQRSVVIWRVYHDLTFAEIAEAESITANNAKVSYCHAVKNLRKVMRPAPGPGTDARRQDTGGAR